MAAARRMVLDRVIQSTRQQLLLMTRSTRNRLQQSRNFVGEFVMKKIGGYEKAIFNHLQQQQQSRSLNVAASDEDFLGANKLGKQFLMNDKQQLVPLESLRGKVVGLYFEGALKRYFSIEYRVACSFREFYTILKRTKPDSFEMIYVPPDHQLEDEDQSSLHNDAVSTLPWLSIPVHDHHWRSYLRQLYNPRDYSTHVFFIDTRDNKVQFLPRYSLLDISNYGPLFYPFTDERVQQLKAAQTLLFGKETSIQAILGSDSRDYLIDRHSNKVLISSLYNKDVLIFHYSSHSYWDERLCLEQLLEIYNELQKHNIEIVSINYDYNWGNTTEEKLWKDHLAQIPWLHLPLGDEQIWPLRMTVHNFMVDCDQSVLLVKPKGESLLDPYGYQVLHIFGVQALPFTRRAAAENLVKRVKGLSFKSYVDEACRLGLDFNSLIRNNANGGTENVSLSTVLEGGKSILVFFASLETCSQERLDSLIDVYLSQDKFEVIFVSIDTYAQSFDEHFFIMPWLALQKPIERPEHKMLAKNTTKIDFNGYSHFLAFGPDQLLLQVGLLTKSFQNCEFPFVTDAESAEHVAYCITKSLEFGEEVDGTYTYGGDGWWKGIEYEFEAYDEGLFYFNNDDGFYG